MRQLRTYLLVTLLALLASALPARAYYKETLNFSWSVNGDNTLFTIKRESAIVFYSTPPKIENTNPAQYLQYFNGNTIYNERFQLQILGYLRYDLAGNSSVETDGKVTITITSSMMKINEVTLLRSTGASIIYSPENNVVKIELPEEVRIHFDGIRVDYSPIVTLADFTRMKDGSYEIATREDLLNLGFLVNYCDNHCSGVTFRQTADILLMNASYERIGFDTNHSFQGTYDGQGYSINGVNLILEDKVTGDYVGLFGCIENGAVQNAVLIGCEFVGRAHVGAVAGYIKDGTVSNCRVLNTTINTKEYYATAHGGVVGTSEGSAIIGCLSATTVTRPGSYPAKQFGGIVGNNIGGIVRDCLFIGTSVESTETFGSIAGNDDEGTFINNYHMAADIGGVNGTDIVGASFAYYVGLGSYVTLAGDETTYDVSGITAIGSYAMRYENRLFSGEGQTLTFGSNASGGYVYKYSVNQSPIAGNTLIMPDNSVYVTAAQIPALTLTMKPAILNGMMSYWATFYGNNNWLLPAGAQAYTMGTDHRLYRLGTDGRIIPHQTAVVIIADASALTNVTAQSGTLTMEYTNGTASVIGDNILQGANGSVTMSNVSGTAYVLGIVGSAVGFYPYTGNYMSANKAYYVQ